jgi:hypothetical protein
MIKDLGTAMLGGSMAILTLFIMLYILQPVIFEKYVQETAYDISINRNVANDDYVYMIAKLCEMKEDDEGKIYCVYNFFHGSINYKVQDKINSIEYTLTNSTDCKNAMVFYCSVFRKLNISCHPALIDKHTWAVVQYDDGYCNIDQYIIDCH